jgi:hypothetical protein
MKNHRYTNEMWKKAVRPPSALNIAALIFAMMFCAAAHAQNVSEASSINLGNGVTLDSVIVSTADPLSDFFLTLTSVTGTSTNRRTVVARGVPSSTSTPAGITAATTALAAYGVLFGTVTPKYASYVAAANGVLVAFQEGNPNRPIVLGSVNNGGTEAGEPSVSEIVVSKVGGLSSPTLFGEALAGSNPLLAQFGYANPLAPAPGPACGGVTTQLDIDPNDNLLVGVFQTDGTPLPGVTVTISVPSTAGTAQLQAMTGVNGFAQFSGPQTNLTGITLQVTNAGVISTCVAAGNPNPPCDTSTAPVTGVTIVNTGELSAWLKITPRFDPLSEIPSGVSLSATPKV